MNLRYAAVILGVVGDVSAATICSCSELTVLESGFPLAVVVPEGYQEFIVISSSSVSHATAYLYWDNGSLNFEATVVGGDLADRISVSLLGDSGPWLFLDVDISSAFGDGNSTTYFDAYEPAWIYQFLAVSGSDKAFQAEIHHAGGGITSLLTRNAIPEPSSVLLLILGAIGILRRNGMVEQCAAPQI